MKTIEVGETYLVKVGNRLVPFRVDAKRIVGTTPNGSFYDYAGRYAGEKTVYDVTNLETGQQETFQSSRKFRSKQ